MAMHAGAREALHWRWSVLHGGAATYEHYLASWPDGHHADQARRAADEHRWEAARAADTPESLARYLDAHPGGVYASEAAIRLEALRWETAVNTDSVEAYTAYVEAHEDGAHASEAREHIEVLHWDAAGAPARSRPIRST